MHYPKILCVGDSLTLPRGNDVKYEDTWLFLLKKYFSRFDFITHFKRGITTNVLVEWGGGELNNTNNFPYGADCLEHFNPDIVILQLGIVDCAPRLLKKGLETRIVSRLPEKVAKIYINLLKKIRGRNRTNTFVSIKKFEENLINYFNRCKRQELSLAIVIKIGTPSEEMVSKNPNIIKNVEIYNAIYDKMQDLFPFVKCIDPLNSKQEKNEIFVDGYHPNKLGNNIVYKMLKNELLEWQV